MRSVNYKDYFSVDEIVEKIKAYLPSLDVSRFRQAFGFAEEAHRGQFRKDGTTPYISHPVAALEYLIELRADEDTLISCLLHDVPEDTEKTIHDVKEAFGSKVAFLVDGITKLSKVHYKQNMPERQVESLKKLLLHSAEDLRVVIIKLADRMHNMSTLGNISKDEKRVRIATETLEIYVPIANLLGLRGMKCALEDYCFMHLFPSEYQQITKKLKANKKKRDENFKKFEKVILDSCKSTKLKLDILRREKNVYSIYKKLCAEGKTIDDIDDRIAVTVIAKRVPGCYQALGIIHSKFLPKTDRFKDYIASPKSNGYQSLHTTVFGVDGAITEVQIKTEKMNIEAEYGIASHFFLSKDAAGFFASGSEQTSWVNKVLDLEKNDPDSKSFIEGLKADIFKDRIFAFTPKGEPIDLPQGATALDFAYAIHSEIGDSALKAKINGKRQPISAMLKTRDVVEIITDKASRPSLAWLSFAKTNLARNRILDYLKKLDRKVQIDAGRKMLQKEMDISGFGLIRDLSFKKLNARMKEMQNISFSSLNELLIAVGRGEIIAARVVSLIYDLRKTTRTGKDERVLFKITATNRFGLLKEITEVLYRNVKDMYLFKGWASRYEKDAYFSAEVLVDDINILGKVFAELEQIDDVKEVVRVSKKGIILSAVAAISTILAWILHPVILNYLSSVPESVLPKTWANALIYIGFLLLFVMLYWVQSILSKYFPIFRMKSQKIGWRLTFLVPFLGIATLAAEIIYFGYKLSWGIFLFEIFLIYSYLYFNYRNYKKSLAYMEEEKNAN